jgi:ANTAR domain
MVGESWGRAQPLALHEWSEDEAQVALRRLLRVTAVSLEHRSHLERALAGRIAVEQAKGVLSERLRVSVDDAFELMRRAARTSRRPVREVAAEVLCERETPAALLVALQDLLGRGEMR